MKTSAIVDYKGRPTFIKLRSTANPHTDEWNIFEYVNGVSRPVISLDMPKGWQPSELVRVNGILGKGENK